MFLTFQKDVDQEVLQGEADSTESGDGGDDQDKGEREVAAEGVLRLLTELVILGRSVAGYSS